LFLHPVPEPEEAAQVYEQDYFKGAEHGHGYVDYDTDKEAMRETFGDHVRKFEKILSKKGKLLDVGAATGFFMKIANEKDWQTHGVELSPYAAEVARKKGLKVETGTLRKLTLPKESFDVVTMWDVVEHMPDPVGDIRIAHSMLRPGGLLAINTPDSGSLYSKIMGSRWHLFVPPEHIWYFNRKSLRRLLQNQGFEVLEARCIGKKFTVEYVVSFLYRWQKLSLWKRLSEKISGTRIGRLFVPINFRDNMYVLARKKNNS
jgi:2-polyprenyl-3-methyl-5-hydroxy-6-metoxy-1,4-benzoquinol methylase